MILIWSYEKPKNDMDYPLPCRKGSDERKLLEKELITMKDRTEEIPLIIGGKEVRTDDIVEISSPHDHSLVLAKAHIAGPDQIHDAIEDLLAAREAWSDLEWYHRATIFRKAADLLSCKYRVRNLASIMLNQSKNPYEADIDLAELVDFWRFNTYYMRWLYEQQPDDFPGEKNRLDWRPLEGFVFAIPPFNFYSISGNLASAPALMGNVLLWKPARSVIPSNYEIMKILLEAGLPPGTIDFVPFDSKHAGMVLEHQELAGVHFTGSHGTLMSVMGTIGRNIGIYKNIPRIVGEAGGKDFVLMHTSADLKNTVMNLIRGAFGYQGQKCSAASRAYIPASRWDEVKELLTREVKDIKVGPTEDLSNFMGAVIDNKAFDKIMSYIELANKDRASYEVISGGTGDRLKGYFIRPTVVLSKDPSSRLMEEEIFGPVLTVYVYPDEDYQGTLELIDSTSPYALTGSIFARDRDAISKAEKVLRHSAGNFYINDKPTGAIVGRQPFGGTRHSGTDDKAGSWLNLLRWTAPRTIKESTQDISDWRYDFMG